MKRQGIRFSTFALLWMAEAVQQIPLSVPTPATFYTPRLRPEPNFPDSWNRGAPFCLGLNFTSLVSKNVAVEKSISVSLDLSAVIWKGEISPTLHTCIFIIVKY